MSNKHNGGNGTNGLSGIDNLTPFEYALAGVTPPSNQDSPSLIVIEAMRLLAAEVEDAPITDPRLQEFIRDGGPANRRINRRAFKARRGGRSDDAMEGGFVDITPVELTDNGPERAEISNLVDPAPDAGAITDGGVIADSGVIADAGEVADGQVDPVLFEEAAPTSEQPAVSIPTASAVDADRALDQAAEAAQRPNPETAEDRNLDGDEDQDLLPWAGDDDEADDGHDLDDHRELPFTDTGVAGAAAAGAGIGVGVGDLDETDFAREFDAIKKAMSVPPLGVDEASGEDDLPGVTPGDGATVALEAVDGVDAAVAADRQHDQGDIEAGLAEPVAPLLSEDEAEAVEPESSPDQIEHRDQSGRFAGGILLDDAAPAGTVPFIDEAAADLGDSIIGADNHVDTDDNADGETDSDIDADGDGGLRLAPVDDDDRAPLAAASLTGTVPMPQRRFGGAFWALAGTAAAALVLALGGLLWANSLQDDGDESAGSTVDASGSTETSVEPPASEASSDAEADGDASATGELTEGDDREALAVDGVIDPAEQAATTVTNDQGETDRAEETPDSDATNTGDSQNDGGSSDGDGGEQTATTEDSGESSETEETAAPTTEAPTTTIAPTTAPPVTQPPTTPTPTQPPTTAAPVKPPTFIGDRITLGSYEGPGLSQIRVRLYESQGQSGNRGRLVGQRTTDNGGFYGFDEYPAGCYQLEFDQIPSQVSIGQNQRVQSFCLEEGGQNGRIDALAVVTPPDGCLVERDDGRYWRGIEVYENDGELAESYTFYDRKGKVVRRTKDMGPPDDIDAAGDFEWFGPVNDFKHRDVVSVATEYRGVESAPLTCQRSSDDD